MKSRLKKLIKFGIFTAIAMYLANKVIESVSLLRNLMNEQEDLSFNWNNYKIFYKKTGKGSPVLLIHDLDASSSAKEWSQVVNKLSQNHTVYTLDLLGCGRSDKPDITYTNYLYVLLISEFIEKVIGEKTEVIATGKSGSFIVLAANINKNLFGDITLVNPESLSRLERIPDCRSKAVKWLIDCPILGTSLYYIMHAENQIEYNFTEKYFYNPFQVSTKMIHTYYESAHIGQGSGKHLAASLQGNYVNNTIRFALPKLEQNVHLIFGSELYNAKNIAKSYTELGNKIQCGYVNKTKMLPQLEAPDEFLKLL